MDRGKLLPALRFNFYISPFHDDSINLTFNCVEQYYQFFNAITFADSQSAHMIMTSYSPFACKTLRLKFSVPENKEMLKHYYLDGMKKKVFVEVTNNMYWGKKDVVLKTHNINNSEDGLNTLGQMLTSLAEEFFITDNQ
uniref:Uncharacterized protein n=1 Tax=Strongyloides papillosus TaxID=174720 RepID=A0A0N5CDU8_STREA